MENQTQPVEHFYNPETDDKTPIWLKITVGIVTLLGIYLIYTTI